MLDIASLATLFNSPVRAIKGEVVLFNGSTISASFTYNDKLISFDVERVGESKFFGFGVCHRLNVRLIDTQRELEITTANAFKVYISDVCFFPLFHVTEVHRDENTNELSITAYDALYKAASRTVGELELAAPYTLADFASACASLLGVGLQIDAGAAESFSLSYEGGANLEGTETLREALTAIAEATQTIYYLNPGNAIIFKRLDVAGDPVAEIAKANYFTLESGANRRLATITHATELGDNVSASTTATGSTQFIRDNPFLELREDVASILQSAIATVGGLTINQFSCAWRGNPLLEIGDKIRLTAKDDSSVISYLLSDTISYNGALQEVTEWRYEGDEAETESNPVSLGDTLKQTYARVDKANREIALVASEVGGNAEAISALQLNTDSIEASVKKVEETTEGALNSLSEDVATLTSQVNATITSEDVQLQIEESLSNGIDEVTTATGFTFNKDGLTVSKTGSEMSTAITEDGMRVYRDSQEVLIADHEGVKAEDLHATTYLIIGKNSRFEDYATDRTGCFWIGGNS